MNYLNYEQPYWKERYFGTAKLGKAIYGSLRSAKFGSVRTEI